jgi:glycosyltransferase involved in cell wall biosynthesis
MRVAHVHRIAGIGGSERHLLALLPALREQDVEVFFIGLDAGTGADAFYAELRRGGVAYERLRGAAADPRLPFRIARAARRFGAEAIHTHLVHADVHGAAAAALLRVPLFSTKHNDDRFRTGAFRHVDRLLARRASLVIVISEALRRFSIDRVGLPADKVEVVRYGLDAPPRAWGPNPPVNLPADVPWLVAIARLVPQKGLDVAVEALARLQNERTVLVVVGEGPERGKLAELALRLGVGDRVALPGRAGDVATLLERAAVFVHPARWEGFGLVLLEAMLAGRAVVATSVSAIPEIVVDGETGLLVQPDDPRALAGAIDRLLADQGERERLGSAGRERANVEFSVARMAAQTAAVYEHAARTTASAHESTE